MSTTILDEIERINDIKRLKNKKKLHSLLDKYGTLENFRQNSTMAEEFEYQFAQGDDIVDEVERERQAMNNLPKTSGSSLDDTDMEKNASIYRARNRQNAFDNSLFLSPMPSIDNSLLKQYSNNQHASTMNDASITTINSKKSNIDYSKYGKGFSKEFIDELIADNEFNKILNEYIIPNEGRFSNRKNDRGQMTMYGISKNAYPNEDIKNLTRERANAIIYRDFYKWNGLYKLPYSIRGFVVDYGMPTSPLNAIKTVHRVLDLPVIGDIIGSQTLNRFNKFSENDYKNFLKQYTSEMEKHYNNIVKNDVTQRENLNGWLNRARRAHLSNW